MPIYAYKCDSCGFAKDVLQKMSDAPLELCPTCQKPSFRKQVTAAGFQLKGSGWYATDFKGGGATSPASETSGSTTSASAAATGDSVASDKPSSTPATPAASPAP